MDNNNRILLILQYLWDNTDKTHTVSLADITRHLESCGITADPRTLRKDIAQLTDFGIDIVVDRRVQNQYHVANRHFEAPEVKLLIDAVQSSRFITNKKSKALIQKLAAFVAPNQKTVPTAATLSRGYSQMRLDIKWSFAKSARRNTLSISATSAV